MTLCGRVAFLQCADHDVTIAPCLLEPKLVGVWEGAGVPLDTAQMRAGVPLNTTTQL